ncbi:MAG: coproporphyrinogen dehydrogenase HemZ [Clostridia bacterium]|nr:coproporphyrinogen dehydrogenase HemZ [Clostridia bacterium]
MDMMQYLDTIQPELMNITRLFGLPDSDWDTPKWRFTAAAEEGSFRCQFTDGEHSAENAVLIPPEEADARLQELHRKRAARRLVRQTLYDLCRKATGIHPPWGSLTGIRPTHLMYEAIGSGCTEAENAKRYVIDHFDVTPEKAELLWEIAQVQGQLPPPEDRWMDVYIGIPFCTTRCTYCSFSSGELGKGVLVEPYLDALFREMDEASRIIADTGRTLRAVYVGGGTPTSLNEDQLSRMLDRMMLRFPGAMEYTVEAGRPDTITPGKLAAIKAVGVGRISINPQTMNDRTLRVIGRAHTAAQVEEAYAMARAADMHHINMDVIAGLPGENADDFAVTMDAALRFRPESLTVHTLAIKRSSRLHLEQAPLPDGETASRMVQMGLETARTLGMQPYYLYRQKYMAGNQENVGYALPGHACQYNVDIMEETTHILALGAGGISKRVYEDEGHIGRAPNVANIEHYISRVDEMIQRKRDLFMPEAGV